MASLLKDAKDYYFTFFENEQWSNDKTSKIRFNTEDKERRLGVIRKIYEIILFSRKSSKCVVKWVTSSLSIREVAVMLGDNPNNVKSELWYFNQSIGSKLEIDGENILKKCILQRNISNSEWKQIQCIINEFILSMGARVFSVNKILSNKNILVNIPAKAEVHRDVTDDEFNSLLNVLEPYFVSSRSKNQQYINESRAVGYLSYILTPGVELDEKDIARQKKVLSYLGSGTKKLFKNKNNEIQQQPQQKQNVEEIKNPDEEVIELDTGYAGYGKTVHMQIK